MPNLVQFTGGHRNQYTYDAGGQKLKAVNFTVNNVVNVPLGTVVDLPTSTTDYTKLTTDYVGNMIYENGALKEILLPEGYYKNGTFYYYLKDHLGDDRVTINSSGAVVEKSHYYPSGTRFFTESTSNSTAIPYRYNGKEIETMNGLNQMDYGARRRFAGLPIWTSIDPLAEKYYSISPYAYCKGNPMNYIDPNGMDAWSTSDPNEIAKFCRQVNNGQSPNTSSWNHQTDEEYLSENAPKNFTFDSKNQMISIQWVSNENNEINLNLKRFSVKKLKNKKLMEMIANGEYKTEDDRLEKLPDAVGITSDVMSTVGGVAKVAGRVTEKALSHALTRPTTVIGAVMAGGPAAARLWNNGFNTRDAVTLGVSGVALILEFGGEGEAIEAAGAAWSAVSVGWDIYNETHPKN